MSLFKRKPKSEHVPEPPVVLPVQSNIYEFIIKSENDESDKMLEKYQKFWTDPEDKYNGMTMRELKDPICTVRRFINTLLSMCPSNCRLSWEMMVPL